MKRKVLRHRPDGGVEVSDESVPSEPESDPEVWSPRQELSEPDDSISEGEIETSSSSHDESLCQWLPLDSSHFSSGILGAGALLLLSTQQDNPNPSSHHGSSCWDGTGGKPTEWPNTLSINENGRSSGSRERISGRNCAGASGSRCSARPNFPGSHHNTFMSPTPTRCPLRRRELPCAGKCAGTWPTASFPGKPPLPRPAPYGYLRTTHRVHFSPSKSLIICEISLFLCISRGLNPGTKTSPGTEGKASSRVQVWGVMNQDVKIFGV